MNARGVLYIHSARPALCPHIEWAAAGVLGVPVRLDWSPQPAAPPGLRAEASWQGERGTASRLASALTGWQIRFEVTEDVAGGSDGERHSFTPSLGLFHASTAINGDVVVTENRLRALLASGQELGDGISRLLGTPWDDELEPFRCAGDGAPVRWLHQVV